MDKYVHVSSVDIYVRSCIHCACTVLYQDSRQLLGRISTSSGTCIWGQNWSIQLCVLGLYCSTKSGLSGAAFSASGQYSAHNRTKTLRSIRTVAHSICDNESCRYLFITNLIRNFLCRFYRVRILLRYLLYNVHLTFPHYLFLQKLYFELYLTTRSP